jgi:hypothetical protein
VQRFRIDPVTGALTEEAAARAQFPGVVLQNQQASFAPWRFIAPATYESWAISPNDGTLSRVAPQSGDCANPAERQRYVHPTRRQIWFDDATNAASLQVCRWQSQTGRWTRQATVQRPAPIRSQNLDFAFDSCLAYPTGARCLGIYAFPLVAIPPLLITQPIDAHPTSGSLDVVPGAVGYLSGASGLGTRTTVDATGKMIVDETFGSQRNLRIARIDPGSGSVVFLPGASFLELPLDSQSTVLAILYGAEPPAM